MRAQEDISHLDFEPDPEVVGDLINTRPAPDDRPDWRLDLLAIVSAVGFCVVFWVAAFYVIKGAV